MTEREATTLLAGIAAGYEKDLSDATISVYVRQLQRYDAADAEPAAQWLFDSCKFFPTLAEIKTAFETVAVGGGVRRKAAVYQRYSQIRLAMQRGESVNPAELAGIEAALGLGRGALGSTGTPRLALVDDRRRA